MVPIKIPLGSNIVEEINGYVASNPDVNIFLFAASFIVLLFSIKKYISIIEKMKSIKDITYSINALYAYFGVKNKLFRMNFKEYKKIKSHLKIEV